MGRSCRQPGVRVAVRKLDPSPPPPGGDQGPAFLAVATAIADQLVRDAVRDEDCCTWLGYEMELVDGEWRSVYQTIDESLYGGLAGVALFLAEMWRQTRNPDYANTASSAANGAMHLIRERRSVTPHGWYSGLIGTLSTVRSVYDMLPETEMADDTSLLHEVLTAATPQDGCFDVIAGPSGTIAGLLTLHGSESGDSILRACHLNGEWLLDRAQSGPGIGLSWQEENAETSHAFPHCGLAHGASSPALALLELWAATRDERYRKAGFRAFEYERQWFDRHQCGWPDLRDVRADQAGDPKAMVYPAYWCYGSGGIALSRLRAWQLTSDKTALAEANAAIFACKRRARQALTTERAGFEENASVCHGLGSIVEPLIYSSQVRPDPEAIALARELGLAMRPPANEEWKCGLVEGGETPGLMLGLAGIGRMYLGLSDPVRFRPSGLVLPASKRGDSA